MNNLTPLYSELAFPDYTLRFIDLNKHERKTVVLLHGLGANASSWELQFPELSKEGFRIIAPDARGFGQSTYGGKIRKISQFADDAAQILHSLKIECVSLAGISLGGLIALQITLDYPALVNKLILINSFAHLRPTRFDQWLYVLVRFLVVHTMGVKSQSRYVSRRIFPHPHQEYLRELLVEQISQADPRAYRAAMQAIARYDVRKRLNEVKIPTLIITANDDSTVSPIIQRALAETIPGSTQVFIADAGHAVTIDKPERVNAELTKFLQAPV